MHVDRVAVEVLEGCGEWFGAVSVSTGSFEGGWGGDLSMCTPFWGPEEMAYMAGVVLVLDRRTRKLFS